MKKAVAIPALGAREQSRRETLDRIRSAAEEIFSVREFDDVKMKEIAIKAGVGEATLFRYIEQKIDLLTLAYGDRMDAILDQIEAADARHEMDSPSITGNDFCQRVRQTYAARCEFFMTHTVNGALYLAQGFNERNPSSARNIAQGDRSIRLSASILADGQRQGVIFGDVNPVHVAQNCHGIYLHEIQRTAIRRFAHDTIWNRVSERLDAQLVPLILRNNSLPQ